MREISDHMLDFVKGGMNLNGLPSSTNVIDLRGKDMGTYIDANGACWAPGTPSIIMYPGGSGPSYSMSSFHIQCKQRQLNKYPPAWPEGIYDVPVRLNFCRLFTKGI
ncbi:hypothetical protein ACYX33_04325 [Escherichia coli]